MDHELIDIHTHIVHGIDDGADSYEESLCLIRMEYDQGVRGIFCTSHSYGMVHQHEEYYKNLVKIKSAVKTMFPDLSLYEGCEMLCEKYNMPETIRRVTGFAQTIPDLPRKAVDLQIVMLKFCHHACDDLHYSDSYSPGVGVDG